MNKRDTYDGSLYVIVNTSKEIEFCFSPGRHYVMPGDEPATFGTLDRAAESLMRLMDEYGHTLETAPLFKLVPVPVDEVEQALARARARETDQDSDVKSFDQAHVKSFDQAHVKPFDQAHVKPFDQAHAKTVALVACSARKLDHPAPAQNLYTGALFRAARAWVEAKGCLWHVLSAQHGLVDPDQVLAPYDTRFKRFAPSEWIDAVWGSLLEKYSGLSVKFKLLAGRAYRNQLMERMRTYPGWSVEAPLAGLGIGQQIAWLRKQVAEMRRYCYAPPSCPDCGDASQATKTYNDAGLAVCWNCKSAFEPGLIGEWVLGDVRPYSVETERGDWVTVLAVDMGHAESLVCAMGLIPVCIQEAEE